MVESWNQSDIRTRSMAPGPPLRSQRLSVSTMGGCPCLFLQTTMSILMRIHFFQDSCSSCCSRRAIRISLMGDNSGGKTGPLRIKDRQTSRDRSSRWLSSFAFIVRTPGSLHTAFQHDLFTRDNLRTSSSSSRGSISAWKTSGSPTARASTMFASPPRSRVGLLERPPMRRSVEGEERVSDFSSAGPVKTIRSSGTWRSSPIKRHASRSI